MSVNLIDFKIKSCVNDFLMSKYIKYFRELCEAWFYFCLDQGHILTKCCSC